jgi:hypothetical protein
MNGKGANSKRIVRWLRQLGLDELAAVLLEAVGPFAFLGAQVAYLVEPLLGAPNNPISDMAQLLEDPNEVSSMIERLRQEEDAT